jgi:hypothetical protein
LAAKAGLGGARRGELSLVIKFLGRYHFGEEGQNGSYEEVSMHKI